MNFLITTTGTPATVTFDDLGGRSFVHPVTNFDLTTEFRIEDLASSADLAAALSGSEITATDGDGNTIQLPSQLQAIQAGYTNGKSAAVPEITTDATRIAFTVRQGSGANTDPIIKGQDGSGVDTTVIYANGRIDAVQFNSVPLTAAGSASNFLNEAGAYIPPPAGDTLIGSSIYVDSINGNDGTGERGKLNKPFLTILAASTATGITSGDTIQVRPGSYTETGTITVPQGVSLEGVGGYEVTAITGDGTNTVVLLSQDSAMSDFTINIPNSSNNGVEYAGAAGVAGVRFLKFNGGGSSTSSGLVNSSTGKIIALEIRYGSGDLGNLLLCSDGILAAQAIHVPGSGSIQRVAKTSSTSTAANRGRLQLLDLNAGNANVEFAVEVGTNGIGVLISLNLFNVKNGLLISGNNAQTDALGGKIQTTSTLNPGNYPTDILTTTGFSVVVSPGLNLADAKTKIDALLEPNFLWDQSIIPNAAGSEFSVNLTQSKSGTRSAAQRTFGSNIFNGFPEQGTELMTGEGGANATFNHVIQMDAVDAVTDITADAASTDLGSFGFGSLAVGEKIAWCSTRRDVQGDWVKYYGILMNQATGPTGGNPTYVWERVIGGRVTGTGTLVGGSGYTAATDVKVTGGSGDGLIVTTTVTTGAVSGVTVTTSGGGYLVGDIVNIPGGDGNATFEVTAATALAWTPFNVEALSVIEQYRYANDVFLRADSKEHVRFGFLDSDLWNVTTLDGAKGHWARVRISNLNSASVLPTFNQLRTTPNHSMWNSKGQYTAHGLAQWRQTLFGAGNLWGEGGSASDYTLTVGTGNSDPQVGPVTSWLHKNKKGRIGSGGSAWDDFLNIQFTIPGGLSTAHPITFKILYSTDTAQGSINDPQKMEMSLLPLAVIGNPIADSAGGKVPIARTTAATYVATTPQTNQQSTSPTQDAITAITFDNFDISSYYEDDIMVIRIGFGFPAQTADINETDIWAIIVEGVQFTNGKIT